MKELLGKIKKVLTEKRRHKVWRRAVGGLMAIAVFCTTYALILPAITLSAQPLCGIEEHTHTDECYGETPETALICTPAEDAGADYVLHTHTELCYNAEGSLICTLDELTEHTHTDGCFTETRSLTCGLDETEGHTHGEACFSRVRGELVCDSADESHTHTDDCYSWSSEQTCTRAESAAHAHTDECYETEKTLTCAETELVLHTRGESCYTDGELTCALPQVTEHEHTAECLSDTSALVICGLEEHEHTEQCYEEPEGFSFTADDAELNLSFTVELPYDAALPSDLSCEIAELDEDDGDYDPMINSLEAPVMDAIGGDDEDTELDVHVYRLAWCSDGAEYALPETAQVTVTVCKTEEDADISLLGYTLASTGGTDGDGFAVYEPTEAETDGETLSMELSGDAAFSVIRTTAAIETADATTTTTQTGYYKKVTNINEIDGSGYYVIVTANGLYRWAGMSSGHYIHGAAIQMNPIKGNNGCYTFQDTITGDTITPNSHENSNWTITTETKSTGTYYKFKQIQTNGESEVYVWRGWASGAYRYTGALQLTYMEQYGVWWINGEPEADLQYYYISMAGLSNNGADNITIDGVSLQKKFYTDAPNNRKDKVYAWISVTSERPTESERGMLIFKWVDGSLTVDASEQEAATLSALPEADTEQTYTYTNVSGEKTETGIDLSSLLAGATATATSTASTSNIEKTVLGNKTTAGSTTDYENQAANDGRLVTNKSIVYGDDDYGAYTEYENDEFSVTLSALAQQWKTGDGSTLTVPLDVIFVLDVSATAISNGLTEEISSVNGAIQNILSDSVQNRVGVVAYSDVAVTGMSLGNSATHGTGGSYITGSSSDNLTIGGTQLSDTAGKGNFMQAGLQKAYEMFEDASEVSGFEENTRQPVIILVSDGEPTISTFNYMWPSSGPFYGDGATEAGIHGFYSVLSAMYFKNMTGVAYGTKALFYSVATVSLGTGDDGLYNRAVLNPTETTVDALPEGTLKTVTEGDYSFQNGSKSEKSANLKHLLLSDEESSGIGTGGGSGGTYMEATKSDSNKNSFSIALGYTASRLRGIYNPYLGSTNATTGYYYCNKLFEQGDGVSLADAFDELVESVTLESGYGYELAEGTNLVITDTVSWYFSVSDEPKLCVAGRFVTYSSFTPTEDEADGGVYGTYIWSGTVARRDIAGNEPDAKAYVGDTTISLDGVTATITTNDYDETVVTWTVPASALAALYPDLYGSFYYEESPIRLIYKVGLSKTYLSDYSLTEGEYPVTSDTTTQAVFTFAGTNPYYTSGSYSGVTAEDGLGYTETVSGNTVTQTLTADGELSVTTKTVIQKSWYGEAGTAATFYILRQVHDADEDVNDAYNDELRANSKKYYLYAKIVMTSNGTVIETYPKAATGTVTEPIVEKQTTNIWWAALELVAAPDYDERVAIFSGTESDVNDNYTGANPIFDYWICEEPVDGYSTSYNVLENGLAAAELTESVDIRYTETGLSVNASTGQVTEWDSTMSGTEKLTAYKLEYSDYSYYTVANAVITNKIMDDYTLPDTGGVGAGYGLLGLALLLPAASGLLRRRGRRRRRRKGGDAM